jgi:glutamyl-tRNA reductase
MVARASKARRRKPMMIVDLAVPRDVEPEAGQLDDIYLYTVDDLGAVVSEGRDARAASVSQAEAIIDARVRDFTAWLSARRALPLLHALKNDADALRREELARAAKALARGEDATAVLEQLSRGLTNKLLHGPMQVLSEGRAEERIVHVVANLHKHAAQDSKSSDAHNS